MTVHLAPRPEKILFALEMNPSWFIRHGRYHAYSALSLGLLSKLWADSGLTELFIIVGSFNENPFT
ncbi:MAG: hypothetical protein ACJA13_001963 [Paraglaciecola sp.]|jgi:hypothetical protein